MVMYHCERLKDLCLRNFLRFGRIISWHGASGGEAIRRGISGSEEDTREDQQASVNQCGGSQRVENGGDARRGVAFESVQFTYPSRPKVPVLRNFSLRVPAGQTVALVGTSGSGKSTVVVLLQRFYDADAGAVRIDDVDIRKLQLKWIEGRQAVKMEEDEHQQTD
ncbi:putative multidrug resistance protein [Zingiber officinale]|nr:putative multidrug resistance protein [Zingiber officinale]